MQKLVRSVVIITPVWNEPLGMIQKFQGQIAVVKEKLNRQDIALRHFFLDDGAVNLPDESAILVRHEKNLGLATTLLDGYNAVLKLRIKPDLVVRMDCQEHDPTEILRVVDNFSHSEISAMFLPVWYWVEGEPRPREKEVTELLAKFVSSLSPLEEETILGTYNQKFPIGYQVYTPEFLAEVLPSLTNGISLFAEMYQTSATWGLDLLAILLAGYLCPSKVDFHFAGFAEPWRENRGADKVLAQQKKAGEMIQVFKHLQNLSVRTT